ncbi:hypothetical protein, partial [Porphyromonas endodontalis]
VRLLCATIFDSVGYVHGACNSTRKSYIEVFDRGNTQCKVAISGGSSGDDVALLLLIYGFNGVTEFVRCVEDKRESLIVEVCTLPPFFGLVVAILCKCESAL